MTIQRGATYRYPIQLKIKNETLSIEDIKEITFSFGSALTRKYPSDKIIMQDKNTLIFPLTEEDTLSLPVSNNLRFQCRIVFQDETIKFTKSKPVMVVNTQFTGVE